MGYAPQRLGFRVPRGVWVVSLILGAVLGAAFWIGPFRPIPADLRLTLDGAGDGPPAVLPNAGAPGEPRFPLVLAVANEGGRTARPVSVSLSVPAHFRVRSSSLPLERERVAGNPLVRYDLAVAERRLVPGEPAQPLTPGDTLWLEPVLDDYYCTTLSDSVPEFVPAPDIPTGSLANLQVYYSFREAVETGRMGGLLDLRLDSTSLHNQPAPAPPTYPTEVREPELPRPELGELRDGGTRTAECGDPDQPLELYTVTWETSAGGRFLVVYLNGAPRKQLFDLNGDSIIELEMWDPDADGRYEARRAANFAIPSFLLPEREPVLVSALDSLVDSPEWERLFADTSRGPFRFTPDSLVPAVLRPAVVVVDSAWVARFHNLAAGPFRFTPDSLVPAAIRPALVDSAWLRRFHDVAAGPFRFAENPPPLRYRPPAPRRPRGPVPLGTPVPYPRPPGGGR